MAGVIGKPKRFWDSWNFVVEYNGQPIGGFQKCTGAGFTRAVAQFQEGGVDGISSQSHGPKKPKDVTLEQGASDNRFFWDWDAAITAGAHDDLRTFTIAQKFGAKVVERIPLVTCALADFEPGDFDRAAEDKKRIQKIVLRPMDIDHEAVS